MAEMPKLESDEAATHIVNDSIITQAPPQNCGPRSYMASFPAKCLFNPLWLNDGCA